MIYVWMICAVGIAMGEQIYNQKTVFEMAVFAQVAHVCDNSI